MGLVLLPAHQSPHPEVTITLADRGHEDVLVVRVLDWRLERKAINAVKPFSFELIVILPVHSYSVEN